MLSLRYAIRSLRKSPILVAAAVLTLTLAIGANITIFSIMDALLLRGLPLPDPGRLVMVWLSWPPKGFPRLPVFRSLYFRLAENNRSFTQIAAFQNEPVNLTIPGQARQLQAARVTSSFFEVLGVPAELGHTLTLAEDVSGAEPVVILSHHLWVDRFGRDPHILGRRIPVNGMAHTVVGVMPEEFRFSIEPVATGLEFRTRDVWLPLRLTPRDRLSWGSTDIQIIGRLKPGAALSAAEAEVAVIRAQHDREAGIPFPMKMRLEKLPDEFQRDLRAGLTMLLGAVGCLLLVACANVANLLLARDSRRRSEFALRLALGAGRMNLLRQALIESFLLSTAAGILGLALGAAVTHQLARWLPATLLRLRPITTNVDALAFAAGICVLAVFLFGLGPAVALVRSDVAAILRDASVVGPRRGRYFRDAVVVCQVTAASCLIIVATLLAQGLHRLQSATTGFTVHSVLTADTALLDPQYSGPPSFVAFFDRLTTQVRTLPGVENAAVVDYLPFGPDSYQMSFQIEGRPARSLQDAPLCVRWAADPGYRDSMGIPLVDGRWFQPSDDDRAPRVAVVDEVAARQYWPGENPVGRRIVFSKGTFTIVGVVGGIRHAALDAEPRPAVYIPFRQMPSPSASLVIRTTPGAHLDAAALRTAMAAVNSSQPLEDIAPMEHLVRESTAARSFQMRMMAGAALLVLVLAIVGLYGVMACHVTERTAEIGVRMALGARGNDILHLVLRKGAWLTALGTGIGLVAMVPLRQILRSQFSGIEIDLTTLALGSALVWLSSTMACLFPAIRAARMQPQHALRLRIR